MIDDPDDRKSTIGYVFSLGFGPVTWACKKQQDLSLSSAEVEYQEAINASHEDLSLQHIFSEFGIEQKQPPPLWCDNQSAIKLFKDPIQHQRNKHIELHMNFIRNLVHDHCCRLFTHLDHVAEIFKPLGVSLGASLESRLSPCS